jgi:hypothetical protein
LQNFVIAENFSAMPNDRPRLIYWSMGGAILLFAILWLLDFPKPMIDDLFYSGAGMNLANGGDFSNPFLVRHFPGQHFFFAYPPVQSYVLAGWFKVFGISAASATAFQLLMYFLMAAAVMAILYRNRAPAWLAWLVPLIATATFLDDGLRSEPLAVALTWCGFAMIECGARRWPAVFFAFLLMFLAGATAPRNAVFDGALILLACWRLWQEPAPGQTAGWRPVLPVLSALATSVFLFLLMIHFRLAEFLAGFRLHAQVVTADKRDLSVALRGHLGVMQLILLGIGAVMSVFAWRLRSERLVHVCAALGAAFCAALFTRTLGYGPGSWAALLFLLFLSAVLIKRLPRPAAIVLGAGLCALLIWQNLPNMVQIHGILSGGIRPDCGNQLAAARALAPTQQHALFVDTSVARYVFDYRTPPGTIDFWFAAPFPHMGAAMKEYNPTDIYLLNPRWRDYAERSTYLAHESRLRWAFLRWSFDACPRFVYVVPAEQCKGLKSEFERP